MTGITNKHMPIFSTVWKISMEAKPTQIRLPMLVEATLAVWKQQCIVEDVDYLDTAYRSAVKFINMQMAGK